MSKDTDGQAVTESEYSQWEYELHGKQEAETLRLQPTDETAQFLAWHAEVVRLAVLAEREACAKVCDSWSKRPDDVGGYCAAAIRARGEEDKFEIKEDRIHRDAAGKRPATAIRARGNT